MSYHPSALRSVARWAALAAVGVLLVGLLVAPHAALTTLWYLAVPILPATFFISTMLWRSICPLATLNEFGNRLGTPRDASPRVLEGFGIAGIVLFYVLVPARHFEFNQHGPILAAVIAVVAALALLSGAFYPVRSAFCNALCPVLPVELLYGQAPLIELERGRCPTCEVCTPRGCLDLAERKAIPQLLGPARRSTRWLATPYGAFFAALPGFIVGYNLVQDGPLSSALIVYGTTLGWALASLALVSLLVTALHLRSEVVLPIIAAVAGLLYYWYAGPSVARQLGAEAPLGMAVRIAGMGVVGFWAVRTLRGFER